MKPRHVIAFVLVILATLALNATRVWATNATVSYSQTCDTATVTLHSTWDGGTIHGTVTGPSPSIAFDVPPLGTTPVTFKILPSPLHVTLSSSNGHLEGTLTHTFTAQPCPTTTVPATTVPAVTTTACPPGTHPDGPTSPCAADVPSSLAPTTAPLSPLPPVSVSNPPEPPPTNAPTVAGGPAIHLPVTCLRMTDCPRVLSIPEPEPSRHLSVDDALAALAVVTAAVFIGLMVVGVRRRGVER